MNKKNVIITVIAVLILGLAAYYIFKPAQEASIHFKTSELTRKDISSTVTATGTIEPIMVVEVGTQVSGIISNIYADYNSVVKKGEILAEIDKVNLQAELKSQELTVESSRVEYEYQKTIYERNKELYKNNLISKSDFETAQYAYDVARTTYERNKASLIKSQTNLSYATIYSPIDGIVLSRAVEEGQTVAASFNTPTLFTIANDLTKMRVVANVDEADIGGVNEGQRATFSVDAYPDDLFEGTITQVRLEATTTSNVVTYEVIIDAPNPSLKLKPGLTANISIFILEKNKVTVLPNSVFAYKPDAETLTALEYNIVPSKEEKDIENEKTLWLLKDKEIKAVKVTIGETDGINTEILSGIGESDKVISSTEIAKAGTQQEASGEKSPFMPQRPGGNRK